MTDRHLSRQKIHCQCLPARNLSLQSELLLLLLSQQLAEKWWHPQEQVLLLLEDFWVGQGIMYRVKRGTGTWQPMGKALVQTQPLLEGEGSGRAKLAPQMPARPCRHLQLPIVCPLTLVQPVWAIQKSDDGCNMADPICSALASVSRP
jgi:hypothetical protein